MAGGWLMVQRVLLGGTGVLWRVGGDAAENQKFVKEHKKKDLPVFGMTCVSFIGTTKHSNHHQRINTHEHIAIACKEQVCVFLVVVVVVVD